MTGGTGFVGRYVLRELARRGHHVKALTRRDQPPTHENVTWILGDLEDTTALDRLVVGADAIVHIAGLIKARSKSEFFAANQGGTRALLDSIERIYLDKPVRYIHISSIVAREPHLSSYAASKAAGEDLVHSAKEHLHWTILRPPAVYGPEDEETQIFFELAGRQLIPVPGSHSNRTALIHAEDLARAIADAAEDRPELRSTTVEVDDGKAEGYTISEILGLIQPDSSPRRRYLSIPQPLLLFVGAVIAGFARAAGRVPMLTPGKARELCHRDWTCHGTRMSTVSSWEPEVPAEVGLPTTLDWYKSAGYL